MRAVNISKRFFSDKKDNNWSMIRREMIADVLQNILKFTAFNLSNSQAVKAELMRAGLDAGNHVFMLIANKWSKYQPDDKYNYGYSKFKNMTVFIPGACFALSGIYNVISPLFSFSQGLSDISELTLNPLSLSIIFLSSFGEFYLYYKNLGDISSQDSHLSFFKRLMLRSRLSFRVIMKKQSVDPIQDAIITENVLAVLGVTMPVVTSFMCYMTGLGWLDLVGEFSNGLVQIYLGYLICKENVQILMGKSVSQSDNQKISEIFLKRNEVKSIDHLKTDWTNDLMRISAVIHYNEDAIVTNLLEELKSDIEKIGLSKEEEIKEIVRRSTYLVITHNAEFIHYVKDEIKQKFPKVTQISLESSNKLLQTTIDIK